MQNYAVHIYFDSVHANLITQIWRALKEADLSHEMFDGAYLPHFSLQIGTVGDITELEAALADYAQQTAPFVINFSHLGVFPTDPGVVYLGLTVTPDLLAFHRAFHQQFAPYFTSQWDHYLPGQWVPHCTVGFKLTPEIVPDVVAMVQKHAQPVINQPIRAEKIGVVEVPNSIECFTFDLQGVS